MLIVLVSNFNVGREKATTSGRETILQSRFCKINFGAYFLAYLIVLKIKHKAQS